MLCIGMISQWNSTIQGKQNKVEFNCFIHPVYNFVFNNIRMVPPHDRIVSLIGSVIDHSYGGGASPAVLLVMER